MVYQNYHRNIMECDTDESHFWNLELEDLDRLESLADSYLSTRENEEETSDSDTDSSSGDNVWLTHFSNPFLVWTHFSTIFLESYCLSDNYISLQSE